MEKLGVIVEKSPTCPLCGAELDQNSTPPTCPVHGTAGIEKPGVNGGKGKEEAHEVQEADESKGDR